MSRPGPVARHALLAGAGLAAGAAALHLGPALTARGPGRRASDALAGRGRPGGIALTFDDGPDPEGTPAVLAELARLGWSATFFLLGSQVQRRPDLVRRVVDGGHEVAVHGHDHRNHLARTPGAVRADLARAQDLVARASGLAPRHVRPPYGVLSGGTVVAAAALDLRPVLWTSWGRDWVETDPRQVASTVLRDLREGGCVLLHDSDVTSRPGSWRTTVASLPLLAEAVQARGWQVRRLDEHRDPA